MHTTSLHHNQSIFDANSVNLSALLGLNSLLKVEVNLDEGTSIE